MNRHKTMSIKCVCVSNLERSNSFQTYSENSYKEKTDLDITAQNRDTAVKNCGYSIETDTEDTYSNNHVKELFVKLNRPTNSKCLCEVADFPDSFFP